MSDDSRAIDYWGSENGLSQSEYFTCIMSYSLTSKQKGKSFINSSWIHTVGDKIVVIVLSFSGTEVP